MKCIITIGISASGKTTFAKSLTNFVNVNRDDVRFGLIDVGGNWGTYKFTKANEKRVTEECDKQIQRAAHNGLNIIVSDTNLHEGRRNALIQKLEGLGYEVEIKEFDITLEEAWKRDSLRQNGVGHSVISRQYEQWLEYKGQQEKQEYNSDLPHCILVDVDGTLAHMNGGRGAFEWDKVDQDTVDDMVKMMVNSYLHGDIINRRIFIMSGRDSVCRKKTRTWLDDNDVLWDEIFMREEGDMRKDSIVKRELFDKHIRGQYNVDFVIDDRPSVCRMWRELGIKVFQVGNPHIEF